MGGDLILTDAQLQAVAYYVRNLIRAESKGVAEVELVETLDGIESFPTIRTLGGIPKIVRAPVRLLSEPAWAAVKELVKQLEDSLSEVDGATGRADQATKESKSATAASTAQTKLSREATEKAIEVLTHPPVVQSDILYVYDIDTHKYVSTGQDMKGTTFTPFLNPTDGLLYWTNNGGLENPEPVRVEGNVMFATFDIDWDSGELFARTMPEYKGAGFELDMVTGNFLAVI